MSPAGRPRTFDRDEALKKAMMVFWEKGFEGTTMADLVAAIGMKAPSVYAAFGNKDALFREVVDIYKNKVEQGPLKVLNDIPAVYAALEQSLRDNVEMFSGPNAPSCLIMAGAINCAPEHQEQVDYLMGLRAQYKEILKARFDRALAEGQLVEETNTNALAEFYFGFIHGIALRARDGSSKAELLTSTEFALQALKLSLKSS